MRELKRETAIRLTLKMWRWLAKTGEEEKYRYFTEVEHREGWPYNSCFLCEYAKQRGSVCGACPYHRQHGRCLPYEGSGDKSRPYSMWARATTDSARKKWAKECIEQLKTLT